MALGTGSSSDVLANAEELFKKAIPVVYEGKTYRLYFAGELYRVYTEMGGQIDFGEFWRLFYKHKNCSVFPSANPVNTIICRKTDVNRNIIWKVIEMKNKGEQRYEIAEDSDDTLLPKNTSQQGKTNIKPEKKKLKGKGSGAAGTQQSKEPKEPKRKVPADIPSKRAKVNPTINNQGPLKTKTIYDELNSSEELFQEAPSKFKSPLELEIPKVNVKDGFAVMKLRIINAFGKGSVIPVSGFNGAMCMTGAGAFDYKKSVCNISKHAHGNLTSFLRCYKEIISIKVLRSSYAILDTQTIANVNRKRLSLFTVPATDRRYLCFMEFLCVNIFAVKSTVFLGDFIDLFEHIYKIKLDSFVGQEVKEFLNNIGSPNIKVLNNKGVYSLVLTPVSDPTYKEWMPPKIWADAMKQERRVFGEDIPDQEGLGISINVSLEKVFSGCYNDDLKEIMRIADLNIPKVVQDINVNQGAVEGIAYSPLWKILRHNVNFDDKRTFFI